MMMGMAAKGKGKGKGKTKTPLQKAPPEKKVWIGNLSSEVKWKDLKAHMDKAGKTKWVEPFKKAGKGTGGACYTSTEAVAEAVKTLNGTVLGGQVLEVDY